MPPPLIPFPLKAFEFQHPPRLLQNGQFATLRPTPQPDFPTYAVTQDGRSIPFKYLRAADFHPSFSPQPPLTTRPTLVLLHGLGVTIQTFAGIAPYLFATHDLLLMDYNSFSAPETWPAGGVNMPMIAAGVWQAVDALGLHHPVSLLGSSLGGGLALLLALLRPAQVRAIGLLNPAIYAQQLPRAYRLARIPIIGELFMAITPAEKLVNGIAYVGYSAPERMSLDIRDSYLRNMRTRRNRRLLMDVMRHLPANARDRSLVAERAHEITQPTLIIWGLQEKLLPPETARRLAAQIPHARLLEFPDLAHLPHEEAPGRIGPLLAAFFSEIAPAPLEIVPS